MQALFSDDIMDRFYNSGFFSSICELAVDVFQKSISAISHHGKRVIRVLEVGAGISFQAPVSATNWLTCSTQEMESSHDACAIRLNRGTTSLFNML
jgi:hypothetical protein